MKKIISHSAAETKEIAAELTKNFSNRVIALSGDLGSGKTTFTQGFAESLGIKDKIISPTFVLIRQHQIPKTKKWLFHIDLYRLEEPINFKDTGIEEIINNSDNIVLIEWAEKAKNQLPKETLWINFRNLEDNKREITIND